MLKRILYVFVFCLSPIWLQAARLNTDIDFASFRYDSTFSIFEFYYTLPDSAVNYKFQEGAYQAELKFSILFTKYDSLVKNLDWRLTYSKSTSANTGHNLLGQKNLLLEPGIYSLRINIVDLIDTNNRVSTKINVLVKDFNNEKLLISDAELSQIIESEKNPSGSYNESFKKNSLYVIPNPSLEVIGTEPKIKVYSEIYNLKLSENYTLEYSLIDAVKNEILTYPKKFKAESKWKIETIEIPVEAVPSGVYFLSVKIKNSNSSKPDSDVTIKRLYILNPDMPPARQENFIESRDFQSSEFAVLDENTADIEFKKSSYIATSYEIDLYDKCSSPEAKKKFLYSFWRKRDVDSNISYNRSRVEYQRLTAYANKYFSYGKNNDGWKTDRGRIIMKYGEPTQRDQKLSDGNKRPYEIWFYAEYQGGTYFYFVDMSGNANYILVHSTVTNEVRNDNWYNQYVIPQNPDTNNNSIYK